MVNRRPVNSTHYAKLYPQNGGLIVTIDSVTSLHRMYRHARILEAAFKCRPQVKRVSHSCRSVASFPFRGPANLLDLRLCRKLRPALQRLHGRSENRRNCDHDHKKNAQQGRVRHINDGANAP